MPLRFVILHHTGVETPHYDFMFEMDEVEPLTTFRCPQWPPVVGDVLEELAEHRQAYLDYEGPVSGNRGQVRRVDAGTIAHVVLASDPPTLGFALDGGQTTDLSISHWLETGIDSATRWIVQTVEQFDRTDEN